MADCTISSSAASSPGCVLSASLRPPPLRRMRPLGSFLPPRNSIRPRPMVLRAIPVASATAAMPPRPAACASLAATRRRSRSSRNGATASKRALIAAASIARGVRQRRLMVILNQAAITWHRGTKQMLAPRGQDDSICDSVILAQALRLQKTLRETQQLINQSLQFLRKREPHQLPAPPKIDNGPVKYVFMDAPHPHW